MENLEVVGSPMKCKNGKMIPANKGDREREEDDDLFGVELAKGE